MPVTSAAQTVIYFLPRNATRCTDGADLDAVKHLKKEFDSPLNFTNRHVVLLIVKNPAASAREINLNNNRELFTFV